MDDIVVRFGRLIEVGAGRMHTPAIRHVTIEITCVVYLLIEAFPLYEGTRVLDRISDEKDSA